MALFSRWMLIGIMALFPAVGHALALGKLKVLSALNEPLNAEIEFTSITDKELKGLSVTLASRADFEAAGVERLGFLSQVKFVVDQRPDGRHFLQLRTDQQINEPFLHLLLQIDWPGGRLVREYTALIDPPYKIAGKAAPVETPVVTPPAPMPELEPAPMAEAPPADMMKEEIPPVAAKPEEPKAPEEPETEAVPPKEEVAKEEVAQEAPPAEAVLEEKFGPPNIATGMAPEEPGAPMVEPLEAVPAAEAVPEAQPTQAQMTEYNVQRGDTLWRIAEKARADNRDVSIEQMILAIYRTNQDAFFGNNVNNLKAGKILKMPEREEVESTTTSEARREFRAQYSAWQEYKLKLASASGAVQVPDAPEVAPEAPAPAPAPEPVKDAAKPSKPAPTATDKVRQDELLKIVRSTLQQEKSTPDQKVAEKESAQETATREQQALADRAATLEESLESRRLENKELSDKVGVVRSQLSKESRLIELESQDLAQQPKPAETKPAEPAAKPAEPAPVPAEKAAAPVPEEKAKIEPLPPAKPAPAPRKRVPLPPPPPEEKDFLATALEAVQSDLLAPVVIGIVVLLSGGIALVYFRRRQKSIAEFEESILSADAISTESPATTGTVVGQQAAAVTTGGDTSFLSDFSQGGMGNIHTDEVDPIAEAEVYLAYGRDETAEEILKEAMVKNPDRHEIKLKLLEIYHQRNDVSAFETLAEELYAAQGGRGGGKVWDKVEEMGRKLNPDNPMFRGGAPGKAPSGAASAKSEAVTRPAPAATTAAAPAGVDFQASAAETAKTEMAGDFDFDIETPAAESNKPAADTDDFSVMMPETPSKAKEETGLESLDLGGAADSGLDFDIGGGEAPEAPAGNEIKWEPEPAAPAAGPEADLEAAAPAGNGEGSAQWDEAATKLDLAKAYIDMGDAEGARSILQEVMAEGSEAQKKQAQELSSQIA
jgi:pilus assembly protein FimV